jgi:hypothetical protein
LRKPEYSWLAGILFTVGVGALLHAAASRISDMASPKQSDLIE